jgi:Tfp pilus assembly protein PilN
MIRINILPEQARRKRAGFAAQNWLKIPMENVVGIAGGVCAVLLAVHILLTGVALATKMHIAGRAKKWEHLSGEKQNIDAVMRELNANRDKLKSIKEISEGKILSWSRILNVISDSIPKGVWLRQISVEDKILLVQGSAVSKVRSEMSSVGGFVARLKESEYILNNFEDFEVGSIQRRRDTTVGVADFSFSLNLQK